LQIVLAAATDGLDIHVTKGNDAAAEAHVVLIPQPHLYRRADRYVNGVTNPEGNLRLTSVPPGQYMAYAFEKIEADGPYALAYNPTAQMNFRDRAVAITVGETGSKPVELRMISAAEAAALLQ
jgi:hypothetical protein